MYGKIKNLSYSKLHTCAISLNKYSDTVLLPTTKFPQKLTGKKVAEQNKHVFEKGAFDELYTWQRTNLADSEFILHDGPPYANGAPHMGHAINKILKDIINRNNILNKKKVHYVPGWDCHGLPIELKALGKNKTNNALHIRSTAREFAKRTIEQQRDVFKSWGVIGDWENPYLTYSIPYVRNQLKQFYKLYNKKLIYRDVKPVYWSPSSRTALAEAELEYNDKHKSTSVVVRFKLNNVPSSLQRFIDLNSPVYALIWTTTPWTLPSNQAICYNPNLSYSFVKSSDASIYLIATELIENVAKLLETNLNIVASFNGHDMEGSTYIYPFKNDEILPFLPGKHATATKGTGLVHTAPAHGPDDFILALNNKIPIKCIVNEAGCYTNDSELFKGLFVLKEGTEAVINYLKSDILSIKDYIHSYPYDWRTKKPIILRASQQWFIDTNSIKNKAIDLLEKVRIYPEKNSAMYKNTFISQLKKRPYWCISRQRVWGVPIPVFYNQSKEPIISESLINHLCQKLAENGTDFWWNLPVKELIPDCVLQEHNINIEDVEKGQDILDIWFDSGISWSSALGDEKIADIYLEGVDQFTGWFQSSLLASVALRNEAPYKSIYVHGFAVDEHGHKMSKSLGNVINPQDIINGGKKQPALGIDTLRWWVACHASQDSTAFISQNVLQASADEVQKIRNTLRFIIGVLNDYNNSFKVEYSSLKAIDKYLLHLLYEFDVQTTDLYNEYQFNKLCIVIINFITNPVSALYYSVTKDRLYCDPIDDISRKSAQFVLNEILIHVSKIIGPIMPHLVEELHMYRAFKDSETFFKSMIKVLPKEYKQPELAKVMDFVLNIKKEINKQTVNTSELQIDLTVSTELYNKLQIFKHQNEYSELTEIFQTSEINLEESSELLAENYLLKTSKTERLLCPRCRRYSSLSTNLCQRCSNVISSLNEIRVSVK